MLLLGVPTFHLSTRLSPGESQRLLLTGSSFLGVQVEVAQVGVLKLTVRRWWSLANQAELLVRLRQHDGGTEVEVVAGIRMGVVLVVVAWAAVCVVPLIVVGTTFAKSFFGLVILLPILSVLVTARLQIRYARNYIRRVLAA
jgi:hypothetical protein